MFNKLMTASAIVLVSGGLAMAQTSGTSTTTGAAGGGSEAAGFQWDQSSQDAFFNDGSLRGDEEVRSAFDALDTEQQAQLRSDCQQYASAGGTTGTGTTGGATTGTGTTSTDSASGGTAATGGTSTDTAASGSATTGTDSTATSSTTGSTADSSMSGTAGGTTGGASATAMPDMASMEELCAKVQSY